MDDLRLPKDVTLDRLEDRKQLLAGFGTGPNTGKISIRFSANGIKSHVVIDVTGYLQ